MSFRSSCPGVNRVRFRKLASNVAMKYTLCHSAILLCTGQLQYFFIDKASECVREASFIEHHPPARSEAEASAVDKQTWNSRLRTFSSIGVGGG